MIGISRSATAFGLAGTLCLGCISSDAAPQPATGGTGGADAAPDTTAPEAAAGSAGQSGADGGAEAGEEAGEDAAKQELGWYACPFQPGMFAECAKFEVPLDWDDPGGPKISYFVKRSPAKTQPARGQIWLLQGGPGYSDTTLEGFAPLFNKLADDLDLYFPDHRGTGGSERLECADFDQAAIGSEPLDPDVVAAAASPCAEALKAKYGAGLAHFSAADAARDVGELITQTVQPGQQVFVWGASYGTRWAHRYVQQFPSQAAGVIFDSIVDESTDFFNFDKNINEGAKRLFEACGADTFCQGKLGVDAWVKAQAVLAKLETPGYCATTENLGKDNYRALIGALAQKDYVSRTLVAPILYRLDRCDATDQKVIVNLLTSMRNSTASSAKYFSGALHFNVVSSEITSNPYPTQAELETLDATLPVSSVQMTSYGAVRALWPVYDPAPWRGAWATTTTPFLMLNGTHDVQTPLTDATAFASHYTAAHQTLVTIERASHGAINNSPVEGAEQACGATITGQFLQDPTATLDTACATQTKPIDFERKGYSFGAGTVDLWENQPPPPPPPSQPSAKPYGLHKINVLDILRRPAPGVSGGKP